MAPGGADRRLGHDAGGGRAPRRLRALSGVLALVAGVLALVGVGGAWAQRTRPQVVAATGSITCAMSGEVTFSPPLTNTPASTLAMGATLALNRCSTRGSDHPSAYGTATTMVTLGETDCTTVFVSISPIPMGASVTWGPTAIARSTVDFSAFEAATKATTMDAGFLLPAPSDPARVTGSYAGGDGGASSHASAWTTRTVSQLTAACGRSSGLAQVAVRGKITLG